MRIPVDSRSDDNIKQADIAPNNKLLNVIQGLISKSEDIRLISIQNLVNACYDLKESIRLKVVYFEMLMKNILIYINQSLNLKQSNYGYKLLWLLSLTSSPSDLFLIDQSWLSLSTVILSSSFNECSVHYIALVSFLLIDFPKNSVIIALSGKLVDWFNEVESIVIWNVLTSIFKEYTTLSGSNNPFLSVFHVNILSCMSTMATRGHVLPGLFLSQLILFLFRYTFRP